MTFKKAGHFKKCFFLGFFCFFFISCHSTKSNSQEGITAETRGEIPDEYLEDEDYSKVLATWQQDVALYENLEMYFSGSAIIFTPEMAVAYKKRYEKIYNSKDYDPNLIPADPNTVSVLVNFYTSFYAYRELENKKIWSAQLTVDHKSYQPSQIIAYKNNAQLSAFLPTKSVWFHQYVIQYQVPQGTLLQKPLEFSLRSGIAKADYYWR